MRRLRWLAAALLLLPGGLHAQSPLKYPVSWEAVPGSAGYLVEVETLTREPLFSRQVGENLTQFPLLPGSYFLRITTLNRFLRPQGTTGWIAFQVAKPAPPALASVPVPPAVPVPAPATLDPQVTAPAPPEPPVQAVQPATLPPAVLPAASAQPLHRNLLLSAAWSYFVPGSPWSAIYPASPRGAEIGAEYYSNQGLSFGGTVLFGGIEALGEYSSFSSDSGNSTLAPSSLTLDSVSLAPSLEADFSFLQLRASLGGGVVYSNLQGQNSSGNAESVQSIDVFVSSRSALDFPIWDFLMVETALEYRHFFLTTPLDLVSASVGLVVALGACRT